MKIVVCGSMTACKRMVEVERALLELGHEEVVLPSFTHDYADMNIVEVGGGSNAQ